MLQRVYFLALPLVCLSSIVLDKYNQKAIILSDYCPSIKGCQDGSHVMCLHYNPAKTHGPRCVNVINISMTADYAQLVVDICNRIRSKIAYGLVKGEGNVELPRGYGIPKLSWDPELATLAQVWANQCTIRWDPCRATKKYPNPGQSLGLIRHTIADWMPLSMESDLMFNSTTLTLDKIRYTIISILRAWYETKNEITPDKITYHDVIGHLKHNQFIQIISSRTTHLGCGLSAYSHYNYNTKNAALLYNTVLIVCNFSYRPNIGESIYTTKPPTEPGYTLKCGCPLGYDEDEDCLCYETDREISVHCTESGRCKPSVVLLPIFTVEDAPLNVLKQNNTNGVIAKTASPRNDKLKRKPFIDYTRSKNNDVQIIKQDSNYKRRMNIDVRNRYFGEKSKHKNILNTSPPHREHYRRNIHQQSIFAKAAVFQLPSSKIKQVVQNATYKNDVKPRKDFSKVQKLVSKYLEGRRIHKSNDNYNSTYNISVTIGPYSSPGKVNNKKHNLSEFTKHQFTYMDLNSTRNQSPKDGIKSLYDENDQMFMNLLDKLEEEVNNIDFNTNEKIVFDEKIRKIYGTLVKKSVVTERSMVNTNISMNRNILDNNNVQNNVHRRNYWLDPNEYTYPNLEERPTNKKPSETIRKYYDKIETDLGNHKYAKKYDKLTFRNEPIYNENIEERELRNMQPRKKLHLNSMSKGNSRPGNYYLKSDLDEYNSLESEKRRHYYDKLNEMQRRVSMIKKNGHHNFVRSQINNKITEDLHLRPVRPSKHGNVRHSRPKEMDLYMPNRARFLHGF